MRKKIMTVCSVLLTGYALLTLTAVSLQFGNLVILGTGILLALDAQFYDRMDRKKKKIINILLTLCLSSALVLTVIMMRAAYGHPVSVDSPDHTLVILGAKVDGHQPSLMLSHRLQAGLEYAEEHPRSLILVTGGQGDNETEAEGIVMKQWLMDHGIEQERILVESQARNTGENLNYSGQIMKEKGLDPEIVIATDSFHQLRARILAKEAGLDPVGTVNARTPVLFIPMYTVREWFALVKAVLFRK